MNPPPPPPSHLRKIINDELPVTLTLTPQANEGGNSRTHGALIYFSEHQVARLLRHQAHEAYVLPDADTKH
jgi:hypothetical protein